MKAFVAVTDNDWFEFLSRRPELDEVNFWTPSGKALARFDEGQPLLFKLHAPYHYVVGGGFFAHFSKVRVSVAWESFGILNGAQSYSEMRARIEKYRRVGPNPREDYEVGCTILVQPFFLDRPRWIPAPSDFDPNIVRGKTYDLTKSPGRELWERVIGERALQSHAVREPGVEIEGPLFGSETFVRQRLGQGAFRIMVTDAYQRQCAVTLEKALPALQAAHIRPVTSGGTHRLDNGLLLRSDVHALFDRGYVTVTPNYTFMASKRLRSDFDNGEHYLQLSGRKILLPPDERDRPACDTLEWHIDSVFLG